MNDKEIVIRNHYDLDKTSEVVGMAKVLKRHIVGQGLYTTIVGKNYAHVEGWQFAGGLLGAFPRVVSVTNLSTTQEIKWQAEVEIVDRKTQQVISRGFAVCSNKEAKKKTFDEYAVLSMAQTRAIGKAYRNVIGWVMKLAGYEATPNEEMTKFGEDSKTAAPAPKQEAQTIASLKCAECKKALTQAEADYSKKVFGRMLCRDDQKNLSQKHGGKK